MALSAKSPAQWCPPNDVVIFAPLKRPVKWHSVIPAFVLGIARVRTALLWSIADQRWPGEK
jgi:hypothetical protein